MIMKNSRKFDFRTAYIDLLIALLMGIVVIFMLTTLLIAPITKNNEGIKKNADYIITLEWPTNIDCDLDLWVRDPQNNIVSFKIPDAGLMYLERDDMGKRRSVFRMDDKEYIIDPDNKEYLTLRGTFPGEYIVNVHSYSCLGSDGKASMAPETMKDIPFTVEVIKINPNFYVAKRIEMKLDRVWQEKTAIRFVMNDDKNISLFKDDFVSIMTGRPFQ
jgi:hypothetical protein